MTRLLPALGLAFTLVAGAAHADSSPYCGMADGAHWADISETLVGIWEMDHLAGYVQAAGMTLPFPPADDSDTVAIATMGDEVFATHPEAQETLLLELADEPRWVAESSDPDVPAPTITPDEAALVYGCDQLEMPRIIGTSQVVIDGMVMNFVYRMLLLDHDRMYGIMEVSGSAHGFPYLARRTVWMERTG